MLFELICATCHHRKDTTRALLQYCILAPLAASEPRSRGGCWRTADTRLTAPKRLHKSVMPSNLLAHFSFRVTASSGNHPFRTMFEQPKKIYSLLFWGLYTAFKCFVSLLKTCWKDRTNANRCVLLFHFFLRAVKRSCESFFDCFTFFLSCKRPVEYR